MDVAADVPADPWTAQAVDRGLRPLDDPPDGAGPGPVQRWQAVNAPHLVALVRAGARFERGHLVERSESHAA